MMNHQVYSPRPATLDELENNIRREVGDLDPAMIKRALKDMMVRANLCVNANGGHFES